MHMERKKITLSVSEENIDILPIINFLKNRKGLTTKCLAATGMFSSVGLGTAFFVAGDFKNTPWQTS